MTRVVCCHGLEIPAELFRVRTDAEAAPRLIAGSGRSGTTWILDVLAQTNTMRPIFEPLHPEAVPGADCFANRYIEPDNEMPDLHEFLDGLFRGEIRSTWTDYRIRPHLLVPRLSMVLSLGRISGFITQSREAAERYVRFRRMLEYSPVLVKIIRGNLMLGWLRKHYAARIVFVARHPGAVVESRLRIGGRSWITEPVLDLFRHKEVLGKLWDRYAPLLTARLELAEAHTLIWCIENQLPLERAAIDGYPAIFYEHLLSDSERQWQRIVDALAMKHSPFGEEILAKPSQQSALIRLKKAGIEKQSWMHRLPKHHKKGIQRILDETGVTQYSMRETAPLVTVGEC